MSYEAYKQQLQFHTKMVYRRTTSNGTTASGAVSNTQAGKHERQGSEEEKKISPNISESQSKLKRPLSQDNDEPHTKKLKITNTV